LQWQLVRTRKDPKALDQCASRCISPSFRGTQAPPLGTYRRRLAESPAEQARWDELAAQQQLQAEVPVVAL